MTHWTQLAAPPLGLPACRYCLTVIDEGAPQTVVQDGWHYCNAGCRDAFVQYGEATAGGLAKQGGKPPHVSLPESI